MREGVGHQEGDDRERADPLEELSHIIPRVEEIGAQPVRVCRERDHAARVARDSPERARALIAKDGAEPALSANAEVERARARARAHKKRKKIKKRDETKARLKKLSKKNAPIQKKNKLPESLCEIQNWREKKSIAAALCVCVCVEDA